MSSEADELYDVVALPGAVHPTALGFKTDEIRRNIWFQHAGAARAGPRPNENRTIAASSDTGGSRP